MKTRIILGVFLMLTLLAMFGPVAPRPKAAGALPPAPRAAPVPIDLYQGKPRKNVSIPKDLLRPTQRGPSLKLPPITAEELKSAAMKSGAGSRIQTLNGKDYVIKKIGKALVPIAIPLNKYVAQLNQYETFLNGFGYTLRSGPLANGLKIPTTKSNDLGTILFLDRKATLPPVNVVKSKPKFEVEIDPIAYAKGRQISIIEDNQGGEFNPAAGRGYVSQQQIQSLKEKYKNKYTTARSSGREIDTKGKTAPQAATVHREAFNNFVQQIMLPTGSASNPNRILTWLKPSDCALPSSPSAVAPICDCDKPLSQLSQECQAACSGVRLNPTCGNPPCDTAGNSSGTSSNTSESAGMVTGETNNSGDAACLYSGYLNNKGWGGVSWCSSTSGGNGWFDADLCLESSFYACKTTTDNTSLTIQNSGAIHFDVKLFGESFDILTAESSDSYENGQHNPGDTSVVAFGGLDVGTGGYDQTFIGPSATFPVGPIPINISSQLEAHLGIDQTESGISPFQQFPTQCGADGTGQMGTDLAINGNATVKVTAAIDALVVEVGVDANLILANDTFTTKMVDTIDPKNNNINVAPNFSYNLHHLDGYLDLFADIDLLFVTKRFEVEIFRWNGIDAKDSLPHSGDEYSPKNFKASKGTS